ncbi:hypothetical protein ACFPRL_34130 [Pseudoclavibacter helvolus]
MLATLTTARLDRHEGTGHDEADDADREGDPLQPAHDRGDAFGARRLDGRGVRDAQRGDGGCVVSDERDSGDEFEAHDGPFSGWCARHQ